MESETASYRSVRAALAAAFASVDSVHRSSAISHLGGEAATRRTSKPLTATCHGERRSFAAPEHSAFDRAADGGIALTLIRQKLNEPQQAAVMARYWWGADKSRVYAALAEWLQAGMTGSPDAGYMARVAAEWAGDRKARKIPESEWARRLNATPSTLYRWRRGNPRTDSKGGMQLLDELMAQVEAIMAEAMAKPDAHGNSMIPLNEAA